MGLPPPAKLVLQPLAVHAQQVKAAERILKELNRREGFGPHPLPSRQSDLQLEEAHTDGIPGRWTGEGRVERPSAFNVRLVVITDVAQARQALWHQRAKVEEGARNAATPASSTEAPNRGL